MALRDNINKAYADQQKLRNAAPSQGISPLTERRANNNRNADSLKMAGTQQAQQGAMTQLAKDPQAVQTGALAQQQELEAQQRYLQSQQFQPQAGAQSIEDFQSEAIEKAQENVSAQAQALNQKYAPYGSLGSRIGNAVMEEMAQGGEVAAQFERDDAILTEAAEALAADDANAERVKEAIKFVLDSVESGDVNAAVTYLKNNEGLFKKDGDTGAQLTQIMEALKIDPKSQQDMISSAIVEGVINPDEMTLGFALGNNFIDEIDLGIALDEITEEFGTDWESMTISQFTEAVEKLYDKDTKDRARILKQLQDPNTDASIKRELRRELQMLDASGVTSAYEAAGRAVKRTKQIDKIAIGGELKNIDEVLDDENIKNKTDELLRQLQDNPDKVQSILAEWKEDNPGYEDMGDWILEQQQEVIVKGETVVDSSDLLKKRDEEATKTVEENQLFEGQDGGGLTEAHIAVLEEVGLITEGFGKFGNEEFMETDPTYQALVQAQADNPEKFLRFMNALTIGIGEFKFEKKHLEGLGEATNLNAIIDTLSDDAKARKFAHIAQMNEDLASVEFDVDDSTSETYGELFRKAFGSNHDLQGATKNDIQKYLDDIANFTKYLLTDSEKKWYEKNKNSQLGLSGTFKKIDIENKMKNQELFGFDEEELENIRNLQAIFDADGDGKIDSPATIKATLMGGEDGMFADGINLKDIGSDEYNTLNSLFTGSNENYDTLINTHITEAAETWDETYQKPAETAATDNQKFDEDEPWVSNNSELKNHPQMKKLSSSETKFLTKWFKGEMGKSQAATSVLKAIIKNPDIFDSMPEGDGSGLMSFPESEFNKWFAKNIGSGNGQRWLAAVAASIDPNYVPDPGSAYIAVWDDFRERVLKKIKDLYNPIANDIRPKQKKYNENKTIIREAAKGNPYSDLLG